MRRDYPYPRGSTPSIPARTPWPRGGSARQLGMARSHELDDGIVVLRPPTDGDVDEIFSAVRESLDEVMPWMAWCHPGYQRVETAEWVRSTEQAWANETEYPFAIFDRPTGALLGTCGL